MERGWEKNVEGKDDNKSEEKEKRIKPMHTDDGDGKIDTKEENVAGSQ